MDTLPPTSQVNALPLYSRATFTVSWSGQDGASGIASYDIQVCSDPCNEPTSGGGAWQDWLTQTTALSATFSGEDGRTYAFRCRARDRAGNVEPWPELPDAQTTVDAVPPESRVRPLPEYSPAAFPVTWEGQDAASGIASYDIQFCIGDCTDPLAVWTDWLQGTPYTSSLFTGGQDGRTYAFRSRAHDRAGNVEPWPAAPDASTWVDALPPTSTVEPLPAYSPASFTVSWRGEDNASGLDSFDVQFCTEGCDGEASWVDWLTRTTALSSTFSEGEDGRTYFFRCRARDRVGNEAQWPLKPPAWTTVDTSPPASQVEPLPKFSPLTFTVSWSGRDDGSGIASYDIQLCTETCLSPGNECCQDWLVGVTYTTAIFTGSHGQRYAFRSRARDRLGNLEEYPPEPDTYTVVDGEPPVTWMEAPSSGGDARQVLLRWGGLDKFSGLASYSLFFRDESAEAWQLWQEGITSTQALFTGEAGHTYYFCVRGVDRAGNVEDKGCPGPAGGWPIVGEVVWVVAPASRVEPLPPDAPGSSFEVRWSGVPEEVLYQVQVRDVNGGVWTDWLVTKDRSAVFRGQPGHTYAFRYRAQDLRSGVWEAWPWGEDTRTRLPPAELQDRSFPGGMGSSRGIAGSRVIYDALPRPV